MRVRSTWFSSASIFARRTRNGFTFRLTTKAKKTNGVKSQVYYFRSTICRLWNHRITCRPLTCIGRNLSTQVCSFRKGMKEIVIFRAWHDCNMQNKGGRKGSISKAFCNEFHWCVQNNHLATCIFSVRGDQWWHGLGSCKAAPKGRIGRCVSSWRRKASRVIIFSCGKADMSSRGKCSFFLVSHEVKRRAKTVQTNTTAYVVWAINSS